MHESVHFRSNVAFTAAGKSVLYSTNIGQSIVSDDDLVE